MTSREMPLKLSAQKPRVLIVDNDAQVQRSFPRLLTLWGYEPVLAQGQGDALMESAKSLVREFRCSLAVVDLRLVDNFDEEDTSGLKLTHKLAPARPILMSAFGSQALLREMMRKYPDIAFIAKGDAPEAKRHVLDEEAAKVSALKRGIHFQDRGALSSIPQTTFGQVIQQYPDQVADILARLFPRARRLTVEKFDSSGALRHLSTVPRPRSLVLKVSEDDLDPVIVKLARVEKMQREIDRYEKHLQRRMGRFVPDLQNKVLLWDIGGAAYSYVGDFDARTFSRFYEEKPIEDILESLTSFFTGVWQKCYDKRREETDVYLLDLYNQVWDEWFDPGIFKIPGAPPANALYGELNLPEPVDWFRRKIVQHSRGNLGRVQKTYLAVTHGDLHGDNLMIDNKRNAWPIDFERTGEGHILQDFVELEADIIMRLENQEDPARYHRLWLPVARPMELDALEPAELQCEDPRMRKALQTISHLRCLARECSGLTDARQYVLGLLFNTMFRAKIASGQRDVKRQQRALTLASILCHRLENWEKPWPPKEWRPLLQEEETHA